MTQSRWRRVLSLILSHPRLGALCALFSGVWCALGSALGHFAPNYYHRHAAQFGWAPRWHGLWSFMLLAAIALWCVQSALLLKAELQKRRSAGSVCRRALAWHIGTLTLVLSFGVYAWFVIAAPSELIEVTSHGVLVHGEYYRAVRIERRDSPPGRRPSVTAWLERRVGNMTDKLHVERGKWWPSRLGSYEIALARGRLDSGAAVVRHADEKVVLSANQTTQHGLFTYLIHELHHLGEDAHGKRTHEPSRVDVEINGNKTSLPVDPEWAGSRTFLGWKQSPVVLLRVHRVLTIPLALLAIVLLASGVYLWRRHKRATARSER